MGQFYQKGETKTRPGVYNRFENTSTDKTGGTLYGKCAVPIRASWGPLETVRTFSASERDTLIALYGKDGTADAALELINGGANTVYVYRLGVNGKKGAVTLNDTADSPAGVLKVEALYPGSRSLSVTVRAKLSGAGQKELLVTEGTEILETFSFAEKSGSEAGSELDALMAAVAGTGSRYIALEKRAEGNGVLAEVSSAVLEGGEDPAVLTSDYANAFRAFEPFRFNCVTVDTVDEDVRALLVAYTDRMFEAGRWCMAVMGEPTTTGYLTRLADARSINNKLCVFVGGGWNDNGGPVDGYRAVCRVCGLISATPANESVVHAEIPGAVSLLEHLSDAQLEDAYQNGMLAVSLSADGKVWLDNGVTTLTSPGRDEDGGWKKIKRVSTRIELFDRMDRRLAPMVGRVNATSDGVSLIIQAAQSVLDAMIAEGKLLQGSQILEDADNPLSVDSAWFVIQADDVDTLEKIYLKYQFRFSPAADGRE